ncbi:MAG: molybdopterin converting factor subunit 1 [Alphaproteobacteria bacterium]|nr:molybdopterin converting factor subunit 1 [Alphaproteobacteria bacterium]
MKILYFAWLRQKIGRSEETLDVPAANVAGLIDHLRARGPGYEAAFRDMKSIRCAVNQEHVGLDAKLGPNDEVAFFPPVTGG